MNKEILKVIADNPTLLEEVKKTILAKFEVDIPKSDVGTDDKVLGQILRARLVGVRKVEEAFQEILLHKSMGQENKRINEAR